jgi:hypothetical protein
MVERHGLRILDRRRFDKAVVGLRRRLLVWVRAPGVTLRIVNPKRSS